MITPYDAVSWQHHYWFPLCWYDQFIWCSEVGSILNEFIYFLIFVSYFSLVTLCSWPRHFFAQLYFAQIELFDFVRFFSALWCCVLDRITLRSCSFSAVGIVWRCMTGSVTVFRWFKSCQRPINAVQLTALLYSNNSDHAYGMTLMIQTFSLYNFFPAVYRSSKVRSRHLVAVNQFTRLTPSREEPNSFRSDIQYCEKKHPLGDFRLDSLEIGWKFWKTSELKIP